MSLSPSIEIHRNPIFIIPINNTLGYIRVLTYIYAILWFNDHPSHSTRKSPPGAWAVGMRVASQRWPGKFHSLRIPCVPWACLGASTAWGEKLGKNGFRWILILFFRLVCGKKHGRSDDDRIAPEQSEVSTSHIYKRPIHLQVASSNFRDELIFAVAPVISRCLERRRRSGAFFSRPTSPTTRWWTQTPSYQMERCTERGGRKGRGFVVKIIHHAHPYRFVSWLDFMFMYITLYNCCIYNYIYCYKLLYIYIHCYIVIFY